MTDNIEKVEFHNINGCGVYEVLLFIPDEDLKETRVSQIFMQNKDEMSQNLNGAHVVELTLNTPTVMLVIGEKEDAEDCKKTIDNRIAKLRRKGMRVVK